MQINKICFSMRTLDWYQQIRLTNNHNMRFTYQKKPVILSINQWNNESRSNAQTNEIISFFQTHPLSSTQLHHAGYDKVIDDMRNNILGLRTCDTKGTKRGPEKERNKTQMKLPKITNDCFGNRNSALIQKICSTLQLCNITKYKYPRHTHSMRPIPLVTI